MSELYEIRRWGIFTLIICLVAFFAAFYACAWAFKHWGWLGLAAGLFASYLVVPNAVRFLHLIVAAFGARETDE